MWSTNRGGHRALPRSATSRTATSRTAIAVMAVVASAVLAGCLGPTDPDPTGRNPFGSLDSIVVDGDGVRVRGWAIDPSTTAPVTVTAWRDGKRVDAVASASRPDVGAAHPRYGSRHGYDFRVPGLPAGPHTICVAVDNVGPGEHTRVLGCADLQVGRDPHGRFDTLTAAADGRIRLNGWARDPDTSGSVRVGVVLDGGSLTTLSAGLGTAQVPTAVGIGAGHGFATDVAATPGRHEVCLVLANVGPGSDAWLGCRSVVVPAPLPDRRPVAVLDSVETLSPTSLRIEGVASDPDTTAPLQVRTTVTGSSTSRVATTTTGSNGEFSLVVDDLAPQRLDVCVVVVDAPSASSSGVTTGDRALPCASAVMGDVALATTGSPTWSTDVGPPAGHTLDGIDRDGGVGVALADGSMLWLFGDSLERDRQGRDLYFVDNTAAWAPAARREQTTDAVVSARPVQFVSPLASAVGQFNCPADKPRAAMWPMSATAMSVAGGTQRVVAFFADMCVGGPGQFVERGVAVVDWEYDPSAPPSGVPIRGTVRQQFLFDAAALDWGTASVVVREGGVDVIHAYDCASPAPTGGIQFPNEWGSCTVAKAPAATAHLPASWRWWDGDDWSADRTAAASMVGIPDPSPATDSRAPVAAFNVSWDATSGHYLMAYNPWPGYTSEVYVRASLTPQGPWTEPVTIRMPGCSDRIGTQGYYCYAAGAHVSFSAGGQIGLGYYDQLVGVAPTRGAYRVTRVPFALADRSP